MSYKAITFPERIALGAMREAEWSTTVVRIASGWTQRNQNRSRAIHKWDLSFAVRTVTDYQTVAEHFHEARGQAHSFPFKDYLDFECLAADSYTTLVSANIYQMWKRYGATNSYDRKITRPVSGTITVYRTRSAVTSTISPTIDYDTGQITVAGHVGGDAYTWAGEFIVPCRYSADTLPGAIINRQPGADGEHIIQCESIQIEEVFE